MTRPHLDSGYVDMISNLSKSINSRDDIISNLDGADDLKDHDMGQVDEIHQKQSSEMI